MTLREKWIEKCVNEGAKFNIEKHKDVRESLIEQGRALLKNYDWSTANDEDIFEFEFSPRTRDFSHDTILITTRLWKEIYGLLLKRMENQGFNKRGFVEVEILRLFKRAGIIADYELKNSLIVVKLFVDGPLPPPKSQGPNYPFEFLWTVVKMNKSGQEQEIKAISRETCESLWTNIVKHGHFGSNIHDVIKNPKDLPENPYKNVVAIIYNDDTESFETLGAYYVIGFGWYELKQHYYRSNGLLIDKNTVYGWYEYPTIPLKLENDGMVTVDFNDSKISGINVE